MKSLTRLFIAVGLVAVAAVASAQAPTGIVNSIVLQRLVATGTPDANRTLARHFDALATKYDADAKRGRALATAFVGNPNRPSGNGFGAQYARAAQSAEHWAAAARRMAGYHEQLAAGEDAVVPERVAFFHSGGGAPAPTPEELITLARAARTPSEHHDLEEYYLTVVSAQDAIARTHVAMAQALLANANQRVPQHAIAHCDRRAAEARAAAQQARANAALQHQLANVE